MLREKAKLYRCPVCDTVVEMLDRVGVELVCCGPPMEPLEPNVAEWHAPDHMPMLRHNANGVTVRIGDGRHPMDADHQIEWIELISGSTCIRQFLEPGQKSQISFNGVALDEELTLRAYCNQHGLWQSRINIGLGVARTKPRPGAGTSGIFVHPSWGGACMPCALA